MKRENRFITFLKKIFGFYKRRKKLRIIEKSNNFKIKMCKEAIDAGTCPDDCDSCAWSMDLADAMCVPDTCEYVFSKYRVLLTRRRDL